MASGEMDKVTRHDWVRSQKSEVRGESSDFCPLPQGGIKQDWILANPWPWTILGLGLCVAAWAMVPALRDSLTDIRVVMVFLGVLSAGIGVAIRLNSGRPSFVDGFAPHVRALLVLGLTLLFALMAAAMTVLLLLRFFEINPAGWRLNGLFILWVVACPMSVAAVVCCAKRVGGRKAEVGGRRSGVGLPAPDLRPPISDLRLPTSGSQYLVTPAEEGAALLGLAALTTFCAAWALYNPDSPLEWDTMRVFLAALFVVALGAAPLMVVSQSIRRLVVSLLIVLHFAGICTAVMSAPPAPWLVQQVWGRIYQPYLEFMYLNNAYHFYAPQPGPASYLWFRMYYEDQEGKLWAHWIKVPDMDEKGWHKNAVALEYQRILALTENVVPVDPTPSMYTTARDGTTVYADWFARRLEHSPEHLVIDPVIGKQAPEVDGLLVPYPFFIPVHEQYQKPNANSLALLASYARHVCREKHPEHPEWKVNSVKIYRVVHMIPEVGAFVNEHMDPRDPANYRPFYMGKYNPQGDLLDARRFDASGKLINPGDPYLFWLLPNLREPPNHLLKSPIKCWALRHADDTDWIYTFDETEQRHLLETERKIFKKAGDGR